MLRDILVGALYMEQSPQIDKKPDLTLHTDDLGAARPGSMWERVRRLKRHDSLDATHIESKVLAPELKDEQRLGGGGRFGEREGRGGRVLFKIFRRKDPGAE